MSDKNTPWAEFVAYDLFGHEYNCKYPPNKDLYGLDFEGYATPNPLTFFYDFCINRYGVAFYYDGNDYEAEFTDDVMSGKWFCIICFSWDFRLGEHMHCM